MSPELPTVARNSAGHDPEFCEFGSCPGISRSGHVPGIFDGHEPEFLLERLGAFCKKSEEPILIDVKGFFEPEEAQKAGLRYWRL
jgi:hypothetical protein